MQLSQLSSFELIRPSIRAVNAGFSCLSRSCLLHPPQLPFSFVVLPAQCSPFKRISSSVLYPGAKVPGWLFLSRWYGASVCPPFFFHSFDGCEISWFSPGYMEYMFCHFFSSRGQVFDKRFLATASPLNPFSATRRLRWAFSDFPRLLTVHLTSFLRTVRHCFPGVFTKCFPLTKAG